MGSWGSADLPEGRHSEWYEALDSGCRSSAVLHFCMPHQARTRLGLLNVNYTMFESSRVCERWVRESRRHDLVVAPTESSREAWVEAGFPKERVEICPLGVDPEWFHPGVEPLELRDDSGRDVHEYRTRFLNVSEIIPRKNLDALARVWIRATSRSDDALLILKLSSDASGWLRFRKSLNAIEKELGKKASEAAPMLLTGNIYSEQDMPRLFAAATHYWSMSCGEGWDLPMTEAAACGLKLIAPDHSAYRAYLDSSVARMIPTRTVPAKCPPELEIAALFDGSYWWQPDEEAAAAHIREVIRIGGEGDPSARERIASQFTWDAAAGRLIEILQRLHDEHGVVF